MVCFTTLQRQEDLRISGKIVIPSSLWRLVESANRGSGAIEPV
jgi:hypothetical protein